MSNNSIGLDLITQQDFKSYLDCVRKKLPTNYKHHHVKSIEDISGNINRVKRVILNNDTTLIVKHAPAGGKLARYPQISFSENRLDYEYSWFNLAKEAKRKANKSMPAVPEIYYFDRENRLLIMEDLGVQSLNQWLKSPGSDITELLTEIVNDLKIIHHYSRNQTPAENQAATQNRPYIFSIHLDNPDLVKELWLSKVSKQSTAKEVNLLNEKLNVRDKFLKADAKAVIPHLELMQSQFKQCDNPVFTHGDLHTGSIIVRNNYHASFIDAELSDYGDPAFDLGFLSAHLIAHRYANNEKLSQIHDLIVHLHERYSIFEQANNLAPLKISLKDVFGYAGAEMLRRLIGPANFNINLDIQQFERLLDLAKNLIVKKDSGFLNHDTV